jgi:hypothetical protein
MESSPYILRYLTFGAFLAGCGALMAYSAEENARTKASIVFEGTVTGVRTTTDDFPHAKECITVRATKFLRLPECPRTTLHTAGEQELTVRVTDPAHFHKGGRAVFYTRVWIVKKSVALAEVAPSQRIDASDTRADTARLPGGATLVKRLAAAELVVQG